LEINELKYKLALIFFLIVGNQLQNSLNLLIIISTFELMTALKLLCKEILLPQGVSILVKLIKFHTF
jgi:hypothetical protein